MKTFWVNVATFLCAAILLVFSAKLSVPAAKVWQGLALVFGLYSGCDGLATLITSKQMPKAVNYTVTYSKMTVLVIMAWVLLLEAVILQVLFKDIAPTMDLGVGFLFASAISGIYAGTKKANNGMKNLGDEGG